jgi:hypothetical protein
MYFDIVAALSFSFPFPPPPSCIKQFHYFRHVLHLSLYMIMLVFVCMFIFRICLPCMRENMWPLSFEWPK